MDVILREDIETLGRRGQVVKVAAGYARIAAVHGANPYVVPPSAFPGDPAYAHMGAAWHGTTSAYGPAFTLAAQPVALAVHSSAAAAAWAFKALAAAGVLLAAALAGVLARRTTFAVVTTLEAAPLHEAERFCDLLQAGKSKQALAAFRQLDKEHPARRLH